MTERFRRSELVVFASWIAFAVAGAGFAKLTEDPPFTTLRSTAGPVDIAFDVLLAGAWLSFFGVLVAGVPIALSIAADAIRRRKVVQLALLATPIGAMAIWGLITIVLATRGVPAAGDPMRYIVVGGWFAAFLVAVAVSTLAVSVAALNAEVDGRVYRRAVWPAFVTVAGMTVVTLAALGWAVAVLSSDASAFWSFQGLLASSTALTWLVIFVTMLVATVAALRAARRLRSDAV